MADCLRTALEKAYQQGLFENPFHRNLPDWPDGELLVQVAQQAVANYYSQGTAVILQPGEPYILIYHTQEVPLPDGRHVFHAVYTRDTKLPEKLRLVPALIAGVIAWGPHPVEDLPADTPPSPGN